MRPLAGEAEAEIVAGEQDFGRINRRYVRHLKALAEHPGGALRNDPQPSARILPSDYLGQQALVAVRKDRRRVEVLRDATRQLPAPP